MNRFYHVVAILLVSGVLLGCGENITATEYVDNAKRHLVDGELTAATIELKNALKSEADNAEARWLLGKIYYDLNDMPSADKELRRARQLGVPAEQVSPLLAQAFLKQGKFAELEALSVESLGGEPLATLLSAQGLGHLAQGELAEAGELIGRAIGEASDLAYAQMAKAHLLQAGGDEALIRAQLDVIFALEPEYAPALSLLGDLEMRQNRLEAAEKAYGRALESTLNSTDKFNDHLKRALVLVALQKHDRAQDDVSYLLTRAPKHPSVNYVQGLIYFQQKNLVEAKAALDLALPAKGRYPQVLYYLAAVHLLEGNREQAAAYIGEFHAIAPGNVAGRKLLAKIRLDEKNYTEVEALVRPVLALGLNDAGAMNLLANALLRQGKTDEAIDLLSEVAELAPDSSVAQMRLGAGLLASGEQAGVEHIESALRLDPDYQQGEILLVLNYLRQNELEKALQAAEAYRQRQPDIATPHNLLGRVHMMAKRKAEARKAFQRAREVAPGDPFACQSLALFAMQEQQHSVAEGLYQEVLAHHKDNLPALLKLAALKQLDGDEVGMLEYLERGMETSPSAAQPRLVLARYYLSQDRPEKVAVLLSGLNVGAGNPEVSHLLGQAQLAEGDFHSAQASFEKLLLLKPNAAKGHYLLARAYEGAGRHQDVEAALVKAIDLAPEYIEPRVALARLSLKQGNNQIFERQLEQLELLAPDSPVIWQLQIARAKLKGDEAAVLSVYKKAYKQRPGTGTLLGLAGQKLARSDKNGALSLYRSWLTDHPDDVPVGLALADLQIKMNDMAAAITQYRQVLNNDESNLIALNNLAWFLRDSEPSLAVNYALRAVAIDGESAAVQDTLAMALLADDRLKEAKNAIAKALGKTPDNPSMRFHRILINLASGQKSSGLSELQRLLKAQEAFPERAEAETLLIKLGRGL